MRTPSGNGSKNSATAASKSAIVPRGNSASFRPTNWTISRSSSKDRRIRKSPFDSQASSQSSKPNDNSKSSAVFFATRISSTTTDSTAGRASRASPARAAAQNACSCNSTNATQNSSKKRSRTPNSLPNGAVKYSAASKTRRSDGPKGTNPMDWPCSTAHVPPKGTRIPKSPPWPCGSSCAPPTTNAFATRSPNAPSRP